MAKKGAKTEGCCVKKLGDIVFKLFFFPKEISYKYRLRIVAIL